MHHPKQRTVRDWLLPVCITCTAFLAWLADQTFARHDLDASLVGPSTFTMGAALPGHSTETVALRQTLTSLGFFRPHMTYEQPTYFLNDQDQPFDSVTYSAPGGPFRVETAPPWFAPQTLKADYQVILMTVVGFDRSAFTVVGNIHTNRMVRVDRGSGVFVTWPEFFLEVNSVEQSAEQGTPRARPFDEASEVTLPDAPLHVFSVSGEWLHVGPLVDGSPPERGVAWIRWRQDGEITVTWSLFS